MWKKHVWQEARVWICLKAEPASHGWLTLAFCAPVPVAFGACGVWASAKGFWREAATGIFQTCLEDWDKEEKSRQLLLQQVEKPGSSSYLVISCWVGYQMVYLPDYSLLIKNRESQAGVRTWMMREVLKKPPVSYLFLSSIQKAWDPL